MATLSNHAHPATKICCLTSTAHRTRCFITSICMLGLHRYTQTRVWFLSCPKTQRADSASTRSTRVIGCMCNFGQMTRHCSEQLRETFPIEQTDRDISHKKDACNHNAGTHASHGLLIKKKTYVARGPSSKVRRTPRTTYCEKLMIRRTLHNKKRALTLNLEVH